MASSSVSINSDLPWIPLPSYEEIKERAETREKRAKCISCCCLPLTYPTVALCLILHCPCLVCHPEPHPKTDCMKRWNHWIGILEHRPENHPANKCQLFLKCIHPFNVCSCLDKNVPAHIQLATFLLPDERDQMNVQIPRTQQMAL